MTAKSGVVVKTGVTQKSVSLEYLPFSCSTFGGGDDRLGITANVRLHIYASLLYYRYIADL